MTEVCYKCKEYTEVSKKNTQRNGNPLWICRPCRNYYYKQWKERRQYLIKTTVYEEVARANNTEEWARLAKERLNKISLRA